MPHFFRIVYHEEIMANGSKKSHSKSRNCSYQGPICSNCYRRNELCDYLRGHNDQITIKTSLSDACVTALQLRYAPDLTTLITPVNEQAYYSSFTDFVIALDYYPVLASEQELLASATGFFKGHHDSMILSNCVAPIAREASDYREQLAYLLPTISSLCAIHKSLYDSSQSLNTFAEAVQLNIAASNKFRRAERSIQRSNWLPVLMFGVSHIMFNFAVAKSVPDCAFDHLCVFHVLRSTGSIARHIGSFFEHSQLNSILQQKRQWTVDASIYDGSVYPMNQLGMAPHPPSTSDLVRPHCDQALESLKAWTKSVRGAPQTWKHFITWPSSVTDGFITALTDKQPVALLIYIYWCAVMCGAPRRWYADGWQQRVASAAMSEIDPTYGSFLEWPIFVLSSAIPYEHNR
ncbi:hypothetical protein NPX13_g2710 [Xylaria arbuscula]|uniref:Zn(2)-C6 fungal-type domain-containing protein n=1 Tax=Xylaria arbuscula TaxID=114810 RepID=A0A9W8TQ34_9PEZI|nr:hypothetical protein NPX13_g2710 [Xylaria arbuscula]